MLVSLQLFAMARELVGSDEIQIQCPEASVSALIASLSTEYPEWKALWEASRLADDEGYLAADSPLVAHQRYSLIPPVSGG